jgi:hypothetical protein
VATSGRRYRTYVGTMQGRRLPGGPRPIEQIMAVIAALMLTMVAAAALPYPTPAVFGVGIVLAVAAALALSRIKYDGVPIVGKTLRTAALIVDRRPTVVAVEEVGRQVAANPAAFLVDETSDTAIEAGPGGPR